MNLLMEKSKPKFYPLTLNNTLVSWFYWVLIGWFKTRSFWTFKLIILIERRGNFVSHNFLTLWTSLKSFWKLSMLSKSIILCSTLWMPSPSKGTSRRPRLTTYKIYINIFPVWLRNRFTSAGLELVLSYSIKRCIAAIYSKKN